MDLREWFDSLSFASVERMLGQPESQVMDCKRAPEPSKVGALLGTVISGFANAEGGICLWGVDARKNSQQVDCLESIIGVKDADAFSSRLDELGPQCVSPGVAGVRNKVLMGPDIAIVATYVPPSDGGPHMARSGEDRYYQRIGTSFLRMEHFQIADMFGRRARPQLTLTPLAQGTEIKLRIANDGRGPAQAPYVRLKTLPPFRRYEYGVDGNGNEHLPFKYAEPGQWWVHAAGTDVVIHPGTSLLLGGVYLGFAYKGDIPAECAIEYEIGALGLQLQTGVIKVPL